MKSLTEFISEALIMELSSDKYLAAFKKAKERGDDRLKKFLDAYKDAIEKEMGENDAEDWVKQINKWYKEDKPKLTKLRNMGIDCPIKARFSGKEVDGLNIQLSLFYENGMDFVPRFFNLEKDPKGWRDYIKRSLNRMRIDVSDIEEGTMLLRFTVFEKLSENEWNEYSMDYVSGHTRVLNDDGKLISFDELPDRAQELIRKAIQTFEPDAKL